MLSIIDAVPSTPFAIYTRVRSYSSNTARTTGTTRLLKPKTYRERAPRLLLEAIALPPVFLPHLRRLRIPHVP